MPKAAAMPEARSAMGRGDTTAGPPSGASAPHAPNPTTTGQRWANGGGWVASAAKVATTAYVGPYATVLGGTVNGTARIDDHALFQTCNFYLAASAQTPVEMLRARFGSVVKIGTVQKMREIV